MFLLYTASTQAQRTASVKNNLLYDATLTPNLGVEAAVGKRSSVQLFYGLNPWNGYHGQKRLKHWVLMPEYRYWLSGEQFRGWFTGVHALGGEYNVGGVKLPFGLLKTLRDNHYEGWLIGGGLTLGHAWQLSNHWNLEAALGVGFIHFKYDKYVNEPCGPLLDSGPYNYVGPTKLALNLAYVFGTAPAPPAEPVAPVVKVPYQPDYHLAYLTPQAEQQKSRQLSGSAFLDFPVNKTDIRPDYRRNATELAKVVSTIEQVRADEYTTITHVSIHGYASPEGSYANNTRLAEGRAQAFAAYVRSLIQLPSEVVSVNATPEDWQGLLDYLGTHRTGLGNNHDAILAVAESDIAPDEKERLLRRQYPAEWRQLLEEVFPALRHSDYEVSYTVRPFTVEEACRIIREKPQHLSLNEMFLVANTYQPGSTDYNETFLTAVRMYPADETANLNAAVIALQKGDRDTASRYLQKAGQSPQAQNARGVMAAQQGRFHEAEEILRKTEIPEARHNLEELRKFLESTN